MREDLNVLLKMTNPETPRTASFGGSALVFVFLVTLIGYSAFQSSSGSGPSSFGGTIIGTLALVFGPMFTALLAVIGLCRNEKPDWIPILALILSVAVFFCRSWILSS